MYDRMRPTHYETSTIIQYLSGRYHFKSGQRVVTSSLTTWRICTFRFSTPALSSRASNHLSPTKGPRLVTLLCALCRSDYASPLTFPRLSSRGRRLLVLKMSACSKAETGGEVHDLQLQHRLPS